ncbi:hypothetical protein PF001_g13667 [Phytophthora fragariae]|uniref:Uncharacterized protein n=1 Tax=Phytophthora fragariae TaxID=53985 RepID=A0A6A4D7U5_9STRA|nr:hypothetical protein PF009_g27648 [Phytophthora fragariae]KAE9303173.1 hypothetical protein PF001_g13667 [Phytophthora fragariae]
MLVDAVAELGAVVVRAVNVAVEVLEHEARGLKVRMASQRICLSVAPENDAQSSSAMSFLTLPGNSASWNTSTGALLTELKKLSVFKIIPLDTSDVHHLCG